MWGLNVSVLVCVNVICSDANVAWVCKDDGQLVLKHRIGKSIILALAWACTDSVLQHFLTVKPRRPQIWNVTFNQESNRAVIRIHTPYHNDYLKVENQLFQFFIWTSDKNMVVSWFHFYVPDETTEGFSVCALSKQTQNISASDALGIDMQHLQENSRYHVKVRAVPQTYFQGSWSEWSDTFTFSTPTSKNQLHHHRSFLRMLQEIRRSLLHSSREEQTEADWPGAGDDLHPDCVSGLSGRADFQCSVLLEKQVRPSVASERTPFV